MSPSTAMHKTTSLIRTFPGMSRTSDDPSQRLFSRIRWKLTFWYSAVIAAALIVSGTVLYLGVKQSVLGPLNSQLKSGAVGPPSIAAVWQSGYVSERFSGSENPLFASCPSQSSTFFATACYNPQGKLLYGPVYDTQTGKFPLGPAVSPPTLTKTGPFGSFLDSSLATTAAANGSGFDTVHTGGTGVLSALQRYAVQVRDPADPKRVMGIIQVAIPAGTQASTLEMLLRLLLILGVCTIVFSFLVGLFLANRALLPARMAYGRQRDFIADASHELRTPLTMLRTTVEVVLRGNPQLPEADIALLKDTVAETAHLAAMANNLLSLARLDSDTTRVDDDVVSLSELGVEVARWASHLAAEKGVTIQSTPGEDVMVIGDRALLEESVLILVDNAIKYNQSGGTVDVSTGVDDTRANLTVTDSGIGIAPEHMVRLGERFYRVDKARSRESGGAGLGLSIARSIVAKHNGTISFNSELGHGTSVTMSLPVARRMPGPLGIAGPSGTAGASDPPHGDALNGSLRARPAEPSSSAAGQPQPEESETTGK